MTITSIGTSPTLKMPKGGRLKPDEVEALVPVATLKPPFIVVEPA